MPKIELKKSKGVVDNFSMVDTHRIIHKKDGGKYDDKNYIISNPVEHMKIHGIFREREEALEKLKTVIDDREQVMKVKNKISNQLLAYERMTDVPNKRTVDWLKKELKGVVKKLHEVDSEVVKELKKYSSTDNFAKVCMEVRGVGPITVAYCLVYIDLTKARHASSLWKYVGLDKPSHERYEKGVAGGGNKKLRCILWNMANSQVKSKGAYRDVYDNTKTRLENSDVITHSRNTQGKLIECKWKDVKPCHRHGSALRKVMKHFLADYWYVGRTLLGLDITTIYPVAKLGDSHRMIMPEERGWKY
jgi:hypothetical protein